MQDLRRGIDSVDEEIVRLLDRRAWMARRIGEIKHQKGLAAYAPARERVVLDRVAALSEGEFPRRGLQAVFREIISSSISLEGRLKVSYLGPEATFTHEAALRSFGSSIELEPQTTVAEVFAGVERGDVQHGVVPVENSMEGAVTHTLDELMNSPLKICGEVYLPVSQNLISSEPSIERVRLVLSHPMALAQAASWLRRELPSAGLEEVDSTAEAARRAALEPGVAAVGSVLAAGTHGLTVLARNIQDARANTTRPSRKRAWTYVFFADFLGHPEEERVSRALESLEEHCPYVSLVGAYPEVSPDPA
jgi:chorismate mutase/prephenate dehydratase